MMNLFYFNHENYTGNYLHVDSWQDENTAYLEGIALERKNGTMDVFFQGTDLLSDEMKKKGNIHETFGIFLGNVKNAGDACNLFCRWVQNNPL